MRTLLHIKVCASHCGLEEDSKGFFCDWALVSNNWKHKSDKNGIGDICVY